MDTRKRDIHPEHVKNPEVTYDKTDLSARGITIFLITLAIVGVLTHLVLWGAFRVLAKGDVQPAQPNPMVTSNKQLQNVGGDPSQTFPAPRLQPDPVADMNKFRARELEILHSYGRDEKAGVAHIPIDKAMQMIAQQGLPTRPQAGAPMQPQTQTQATSESDRSKGPSGKESGGKQ